MLSSPRWRAVAGLLASALLLGLYARGGLFWGLGFVALVPWLRVLDGVGRLRGALASGWLMSVAFVAAVFLWFGAAIGSYTGAGAGTGMAVLLVLAPLMQPQLLAFALVRHWVGTHHGPVLRALAGAAAWVGVEWALPKLLGDTLGHGLFPSATLRQAADLGGAALLTVLLVLVNEAVALAIHRRREAWRARGAPLAAAAAVLVAMMAYGQLRLATLAPAPADVPRIKVAMVQASITNYEQLRQEIGAYGVVRKVLDTHYELSWSALRDHGADVLLWSETVYPTTFASPRSEDGAALDREIQGFVDAAGVPLVFGTYDLDAAGEYNAAAFLEPGRGLLGFYRKTHPFPLTEHVPGWLDHAWLRRALPWTGSWQPGDGARVLPLRTADGREVNVLPLICLDDVRSQLSLDGARLGAQAIVGMSNDAWFTDYPAGARLHLSVAAFRSIETRLPQVRVTTNGLSAVIDDTGQVLVNTAMGDQAVLTAELAAQDPAPTLMVRWGDWVGRAALVFLGVLAFQAAMSALTARRAAADLGPLAADAVLLSSRWRALVAALRLIAALGLAWLAADMVLRTGLQVQSLKQLGLFGAVVVLPLVASLAILRMFSARLRIEGAMLVIDQHRQRIEVPLASITSLAPWRLPWPGSGTDLVLASGRRWDRGLAIADPSALARALATAGAAVSPPPGFAARLASLRAVDGRPALEQAWVKFGLFPLLPAAVAFRLHQVIAFGGPFGEAYTYGWGAWLAGLAAWWASWALGLMLLAAALRILVELASLPSLLMVPARAQAVRLLLAWLARAIYFIGVPAWLAVRLLAA
ncbi:MAG TPA: apolipoprotein N-acyltransferase [Arenimonas sp.]|uniref:apolipoprotein N-acyltransferase n=1 Tax=Arenimonas sp. TaxID=1872635 RepID=UPI002D7EE568|nr:apolipoprotein N-acyltransferase [Arenimonas sp.]HEU0154004.1 apolipoprotein N-acyltransferase [Arenimonas sp.]